MALRLRVLELRAVTREGDYGTRVDFSDGLVVLRAENSSGKSTCMQSIIYALGLEGMFGPSHAVPLTPAMTDALFDDDMELSVIESDVWLEIANENGRVMTIKRAAKSDRDNRLISTWDGPLLSDSHGSYTQRDFFVRLEGASQREDGFHHHLAQFIGWTMPEVQMYNGTGRLYMECIFPLLFIEQKRGWSAIQARFPQHLRVRDVSRRSLEFLLDLSKEKLAIDKQKVDDRIDSIRNRWKTSVLRCAYLSRSVYGLVQGLPEEPTAVWPPTPAPIIVVPKEKEWIPLSQQINTLRTTLDKMKTIETPKVEDTAPETTKKLETYRTLLAALENTEDELLRSIEEEKNVMSGLVQRLQALEEDLQRNKDVRRLRKLGSVAKMQVITGECPTCHQSIDDSLLPQNDDQKPMPLDENIQFLEGQKQTFSAMLANSKRLINAREQRLANTRSKIDAYRLEIRTLKKTLISDDRLPSEAQIHERVKLEERVDQMERVIADFSKALVPFSALADEWMSAQIEKRELPEDELSPLDADKLDLFERLFVKQVTSYGISSVRPQSLSISRDSYRPIYQRAYDLDFELSASDMIRMIWAYVLSLLEVDRTYNTNHLGLLVLDEPRQQDAAKVSFRELLQRASKSLEYGQQIIFATSEDPTTLRELLADAPHKYIEFHGKILKKLS